MWRSIKIEQIMQIPEVATIQARMNQNYKIERDGITESTFTFSLIASTCKGSQEEQLRKCFINSQNSVVAGLRCHTARWKNK